MATLRWIVIGILGGAFYSWSVAAAFAHTFAVAWPDWFQLFFESQHWLGTLLWDLAMGLPALLFALLIAFILTKLVRKAMLPAAIVGAMVTFLYTVFSSSGSGWIHASTFIVAGLLPLSAIVLERHCESLKLDTGSTGDS